MKLEIQELEQEKKQIEDIETLINYLNHAIDFNYYTGAYWIYEYNKNSELEKIVLSLNLDEDYLKYLTCYADQEGDIFLYNGYSYDQYPESYTTLENKIQWIINHYDRILTPEEYEEIYIIDKYEYVHEIYEIPEALECFIDYNKLYYELTWDEGIEELDTGNFICFYEVLN